jgi:hypothetical protein
MKSFKEVLKFILLFLWQLPQNLLAIVMMPFMGKLKFVKYDNYCYAFEVINMPSAISLGSFIYLSAYHAKRETVIGHEYGHVIDSQRWGPLYLFVWGIPSALNNVFRFTDCYYDFYTEKSANKHAGLGVDTLCRLYFLDKPNYNKNK